MILPLCDISLQDYIVITLVTHFLHSSRQTNQLTETWPMFLIFYWHKKQVDREAAVNMAMVGSLMSIAVPKGLVLKLLRAYHEVLSQNIILISKVYISQYRRKYIKIDCNHYILHSRFHQSWWGQGGRSQACFSQEEGEGEGRREDGRRRG